MTIMSLRMCSSQGFKRRKIISSAELKRPKKNNALILKEKGLLQVDQPSIDFALSPIGSGDGS